MTLEFFSDSYATTGSQLSLIASSRLHADMPAVVRMHVLHNLPMSFVGL